MADTNLRDLVDSELVVPIRTSSGESPPPDRVPVEGLRHGSDEQGRFLAAYTSPERFAEFGPPGSDSVLMPARLLFQRADEADERVLIDPGSPEQVEIGVDVLPFLAAGLDPARPDALRARKGLGRAKDLAAPHEVPEPFGSELRTALAELDSVEKAWLLRSGEAWTIGIQMDEQAVLADFDGVRNRLHAVANEHLGSRRELAVTDLRAPSLRDDYDSVVAPFYVRQPRSRGFLSRLFGD